MRGLVELEQPPGRAQLVGGHLQDGWQRMFSPGSSLLASTSLCSLTRMLCFQALSPDTHG